MMLTARLGVLGVVDADVMSSRSVEFVTSTFIASYEVGICQSIGLDDVGANDLP